jgi:toxin FitB
MIVLDTNVVSELMRLEPAGAIFTWFARQLPNEVFTTSVTEAEIFYGIELLVAGKRRKSLLDAAETMFTKVFAGRILVFDSDAARAFAKLAADTRGRGRPRSHADTQIAAIVLTRGARLATHNVADFREWELDLIDPWKES